MSNTSYLKLKYCSVCSKRLDRVGKSNIRRVTESNVEILNIVKPIILAKLKKEAINIEVQYDDFVCARCSSFARKYQNNVNNSAINENLCPLISNAMSYYKPDDSNSKLITSDIPALPSTSHSTTVSII